jgi:uncharacterized protein (TIGR02246 family)
MTVPPIEDVVAIHQLYATYNHAIDAGDGEAYCACFTAEGALHRPSGVLQGTDALTAFAKDVAARRIRHLVSNVEVVDVASDTATARAYVTVVRPDAGTFTIVTAGTYRDRLERVDGRWRFAERHYRTMT